MAAVTTDRRLPVTVPGLLRARPTLSATVRGAAGRARTGARAVSGLVPERYRRPLAWTALLCSPTLVLAGALGVGAARGETVWTPAGANAGDQAWLNTLAAPVAAGGDGATMQLPPGAAVLPQGGDLGTLTLTQPADAPVTAPAYGDSTETGRLTASGIPVRVLQAYAAAAAVMGRVDPGCRLHWSLVAGIGRVESNHGRFGGSAVTATGRVTPPILGPRLDGSNSGWATVRDSDDGRYDGDTAFDRAVGPMQFLPGTWRSYGADADRDGAADPQDVDDAALGTARYLCAGGGDLSQQADRWRAVLRYNHSNSYAALVLGLADSYAAGRAVPVPAPPAGVTPPSGGSASPVKPELPAAPSTPAPGPTATTTAPRTDPGVPRGSAPSAGATDPGTSGTTSPTGVTDPTATAQPTTDPAPTDPAPTDPTTGPAPTDSPTTTPATAPGTTDPATTDPVAPPVTPAATGPAPDPTAAPPAADPAPAPPATATDPAPAAVVDPAAGSSASGATV